MSAGQAPVRLTGLSHGGGCACKIGAAELASILAGVPPSGHPALLVGRETADDAAVLQLSDELAIVHTADFFTPIVDDPYDFGRIAAANALSDIYAMGATPVLAINLVAFPVGDLDSGVLTSILRGGAVVADSAGVAVGGGHSVDDPEPKYGMAVTGTVDPARMLTNAGGRAGDQLFLTKPIGGGLIATAAKRGDAAPGTVAAATEVMTTLNAEASVQALDAGASAMTDVTGFGLLGHLHELCAASGAGARIEAGLIEAIDGAIELARAGGAVSAGAARNAAHCERFTGWADSVPFERRALLCDPMTSGGLLVAVPPDRAGQAPGRRIGALVEGTPGEITVA